MRREIRDLGGAAALLVLAYLPVAFTQPHLGGSIATFLALHVALILIPAGFLGRLFLPSTPLLPALVVGTVPATALLVVCGVLEFRFHIPYFALMPPVIAVGVFFRFKREATAAEWQPSMSLLVTCAVFVAAAVAVQTIAFTIPAAPPSPGVPGLYYQDSLWTVGNTVSLERWGLPLRDIRFDGLHLSYHLAQNVYQAIFATYGGLDPFDIHFLLEPTIDRMTLAAICVVVPRVFFGASTQASVVLAALVLFTNSFMGAGHYDLYANPLSYAFGLPAFIVFHALLFRRESLDVRGVPLLAGLTFALAVAAKSNLLLLVPAGLAPWVLRPILRRQWPRRELIWISVAVAIAGGFILATLLRAPPEGSERVVFFPLNPNSLIYKLLLDRLSLGSVGLVLFAIYQFAFLFVMGLRLVVTAAAPFAIVALMLFRQNRKALFAPPIWSYVVAFTCAAMAAIAIADFIGGYWYFVLYPQVLCSLWLAARFDALAAGLRRTLIVGLPLVYAIVSFASTGAAWHRGWSQFPSPDRKLWDARATYDVDEVRALQWLRKYSDDDAVFFSNRRGFAHEADGDIVPRVFGYSAFAERRAYAEGDAFLFGDPKRVALQRWAKVERFLAEPDPARRYVWLMGIPADYFLYCRRFGEPDLSDTPGLVLVKDTRSLQVFRVVRP